jgi:hypothetical protein
MARNIDPQGLMYIASTVGWGQFTVNNTLWCADPSCKLKMTLYVLIASASGLFSEVMFHFLMGTLYALEPPDLRSEDSPEP